MPAAHAWLALLAFSAATGVSGNTIQDSELAELTFEAEQQFQALQRLIDAASAVPTAAYLRKRLAKQVKDAFLRLDKEKAEKLKAKEALVTKVAAVRLGVPVESDFEKLKSQVTASKSFEAKIDKLCATNMGDKADCKSKATDAVFCQLLKRKKPELAAHNCRLTDTHLLEANDEKPRHAEVAEQAEKLPIEAINAQHSESPPAPPVHGPPQGSDESASTSPEGDQLEVRIESKLGPDMGAMFKKLESGRQRVESQLAGLRAAEAAESDPAKKAAIHADVERLEGIQSQMAAHFENVSKLFHA